MYLQLVYIIVSQNEILLSCAGAVEESGSLSSKVLRFNPTRRKESRYMSAIGLSLFYIIPLASCLIRDGTAGKKNFEFLL